MKHKNTKLILNKTAKNLGQPGEIVHVAKGYARNYLLPKKIAEPLTKGRVKYMNEIKARRIAINKARIDEARLIKKQLDSIGKFSIRRKVSGNDNIFGSVTDKDITNLIYNTSGLRIEKSQLQLPVIKNTGMYSLEVELMEDVKTKINLQILPEAI
uniref:ribosomal protein L9 n=1 Tax=Nemalion vermiculare TaxID=935621 RepID=UPI00257F4AF1|nr:ribosomal protein L9 [Nemalion vermiculare]WGV34413.1 ribosomal protein L9 [Nemalion vermiculare]